MNIIDLTGRTAVVTGGGSGIGYATAKRLLASGARVELWGRDLDKLSRASQELTSLGAVTKRVVDVGDFGAVEKGAHAALSELGAIDILINCAGASPEIRPMIEVSLAAWRENMSVNLDGVYYCCRQIVPQMIERKWGRIVNISSIAGKEGNAFQAGYSAAKAGVIGFTKSLAKELATSGVTVNAVTPTVFDTPLLRAAMNDNPDAMRTSVEKIPMRRMGEVDEAAAMIVWIASEQCSFTTGFTFDLSGGRATY
jgi:NAD(P)-dependent dehydrogenase (short-subunit alcohol dehydrogenase family)